MDTRPQGRADYQLAEPQCHFANVPGGPEDVVAQWPINFRNVSILYAARGGRLFDGVQWVTFTAGCTGSWLRRQRCCRQIVLDISRSLDALLCNETRRCASAHWTNTEEQVAQVRVVQSVLNGRELRANQVAAAERDSRLETIKAGCKRLNAEWLEVSVAGNTSAWLVRNRRGRTRP